MGQTSRLVVESVAWTAPTINRLRRHGASVRGSHRAAPASGAGRKIKAVCVVTRTSTRVTSDIAIRAQTIDAAQHPAL